MARRLFNELSPFFLHSAFVELKLGNRSQEALPSHQKDLLRSLGQEPRWAQGLTAQLRECVVNLRVREAHAWARHAVVHRFWC